MDGCVIGLLLLVGVCAIPTVVSHDGDCVPLTTELLQTFGCPIIIEQIQERISDLDFQPYTFLTLTVNQVEVLHFHIGKCNVTGSGVRKIIVLSEISIQLLSQWTNEQFCGSVHAQAHDSLGSLSFNLDMDEYNCPRASKLRCNVELNNFDVDTHGYGLGYGYKNFLPRVLRYIIEQKACKEAAQEIKRSLSITQVP